MNKLVNILASTVVGLGLTMVIKYMFFSKEEIDIIEDTTLNDTEIKEEIKLISDDIDIKIKKAKELNELNELDELYISDGKWEDPNINKSWKKKESKKWYYYLHTSGDLVSNGSNSEEFSHNVMFVKEMWELNLNDRYSIVDFIISARSAGAFEPRLEQLQKKWKITANDYRCYTFISSGMKRKEAIKKSFE